MAAPTDRDDVTTAWRALAGVEGGRGGRTIPVAQGGACRLLAGRSLPGREEALLVGVPPVDLPPDADLPHGVGFVVKAARLDGVARSQAWLALQREPSGSVDLFTQMVVDLIDTLRQMQGAGATSLLRAFLVRIHAWQEFMRRRPVGVLDPQAEIGLLGELAVLAALLEAGVPADEVVRGWQGPSGGLHDFAFAGAAIEVKSSHALTGFRASIRSLEQLDPALVPSLFLAEVRLAEHESGLSLAGQVEGVRAVLDGAARVDFDHRLLQAGYHDDQADEYQRRFVMKGIRYFPVIDDFPRLTRDTVPPAISRARYEIDLARVGLDDIALEEVLQKVGARRT